jgi:hypothetical protein
VTAVIVPRGPLRGYAHFVEHVASAGGPGWDLAALVLMAIAAIAFVGVLR